MVIRGITYCDSKMSKAAQLCMQSMLKNGCDEAEILDERILRPHYFPDELEWMNEETLSNPKGCGLWLWKPFILLRQMLLEMKDGDIIVYSDAGIEWLAPVQNIIDRMDEDIFFFTNGYPHVQWCKMDVIKAINGIQLNDFGNASGNHGYPELNQVQATVIVFRVNDNTRKFVKEWLLWCQMPGFIDDSPSVLPNHPSFKEHRHDQSILTCLQIKYGYKLHFWPTQYSEHIRHTALPGDDYPVLFNHHRRRNNEF